jgi:hypothetical protein
VRRDRDANGSGDGKEREEVGRRVMPSPLKKGSGDSEGGHASRLTERLARVVHGVGKADADDVSNVGVTKGKQTGGSRVAYHRRSSSDQARGDSGVDMDAGWLARSVTINPWDGKTKGKGKGKERDLGEVENNDIGSALHPEREKITEKKEEDRIVPTPIRQRLPPSSFSVTSRPQHPGTSSGSATSSSSPQSQTHFQAPAPAPAQPQLPRQRSTTLIPASTSSSITANIPPLPLERGQVSSTSRNSGATLAPRPRSTTLSSVGGTGTNSGFLFPAPTKPFAGGRRESPASSTGESSSGQVPLTPRDGSDLGNGNEAAGVVAGNGGESRSGNWAGRGEMGEWGSGVSGLGARKGKGRVRGYAKRPSVNFEEEVEQERERRVVEVGRESPGTGEVRRRERRRSEAKAAIEVWASITFIFTVADDRYSWRMI